MDVPRRDFAWDLGGPPAWDGRCPRTEGRPDPGGDLQRSPRHVAIRPLPVVYPRSIRTTTSRTTPYPDYGIASRLLPLPRKRKSCRKMVVEEVQRFPSFRTVIEVLG